MPRRPSTFGVGRRLLGTLTVPPCFRADLVRRGGQSVVYLLMELNWSQEYGATGRNGSGRDDFQLLLCKTLMFEQFSLVN